MKSNKKLSQICHPERSEGSGVPENEILRYAQNDICSFEIVSKTISRVLAVLCAVFVFAETGMALITGEHGNRPIQDRGWPAGSVEVANLASRLGYWEGPPFGGGEYHFLYRCKKTDEFNEALKTFSLIDAEKLELIVHNGPEYSFWLKDSGEESSEPNSQIDWAFTVWTPENWNNLYNRPQSYVIHSDHPNFKKPVASPRIDVYIGGGSTILADVKTPKTIASQALRGVSGSIVWANVKVPKNVLVTDMRPGSVSPEFAGKGLVRGKVFDMATGKPIAGAEIVLAKPEGRDDYKEAMRGRTDKKGFCRIAQIPLGRYEVRVLADGYVPRIQGSYDNARPELHDFEIGLTQPACVKGLVTDPDGRPIEGVKVSASNILGADGFGYPCVGDRSATTDKNGRFEICSLPKGLMSIGCDSSTLHLKSSIFEQHPIPSDQIRLTVTGTGAVWGKVVDKDGKRPAGQIVLELNPPGEERLGKWGYSGYLSEDGTFDISGIPPGQYVVTTRPNPSSANYEPNTGKITIEAGKTYEIEILHEDQRDRAMNIIRKFLERRLKNEQ